MGHWATLSALALTMGCGGAVESPSVEANVEMVTGCPRGSVIGGLFILDEQNWNGNDNTACIQGALNDHTIRILRIKKGGPLSGQEDWPIRSLKVPPNRRNLEIILEPGVRLRAKLGAAIAATDSLLMIAGSGTSRPYNIVVRGASYNNKGRIEYRTEDMYTGEWRHGIQITNADRVTIDQIRVDNTYGDGIYIGDGGSDAIPITARYASDVIIRNTEIDHASRNGIAVVAGKNILIQNCVIKNISKLNPIDGPNGPWAGIDIEPDDDKHPLTNIRVEDCDFYNTGGYAINVALNNAACNMDGRMMGFVASRPRVLSSRSGGIRITGAPAHLKGTIRFENASISNTAFAALHVVDKAFEGPRVEFFNTLINNSNTSPAATEAETRAAIVVNKERTDSILAATAGNVFLHNVTVTNHQADYIWWIHWKNPYWIDTVIGWIDVQQGSTQTFPNGVSNLAVDVF